MAVFIYHENLGNNFIYTNMVDSSYNINMSYRLLLVQLTKMYVMRFYKKIHFSYIGKLTIK